MGLRGTTWVWRWGTLWLTRLFMATNDPAAPHAVRLHRPGQPLRPGEVRAEQLVGGQVGERLDVPLRHQQRVAGEQRADVEERQATSSSSTTWAGRRPATISQNTHGRAAWAASVRP